MEITYNTKLYSLIGNPIDKSLSPIIHNNIFKNLKQNNIYLAFNINQENLKSTIEGFKAMNVGGFNVTIPYKKSIIKYLDDLSTEAKIIGAINTVKNKNGKFIGYNTDGEGFLQTFYNNNISIKDKNCLILGAGGAAYGIGSTLAMHKVKSIYIANRTLESAIKLEKNIKNIDKSIFTQIFDLNLQGLHKENIHIIINTTNIGMYPLENMAPVELNGFSKNTIVYDIIYKPKETKLIKEAESKGMITFNGLSMLLNQAILSQKIWSNGNLEIGHKELEEIEKKLNI
ncbi:shikimate dehydrogenase [Tissierella pigra]|uniref:Shikimate dehydrogenase (NADP(+)) n=1 Tax=Tissierella pigra TaxID=2607614 RepID=A0A6N7XQ71_9FIRM|nr:shikimate dehydrogenase [Tissierella pigra]MBU5426693.1 shikimate dehydrogenase [Tissierella pigra]MST99866.1 shikimate dehydrogenase [Tissierella pigra]